MLNLRHVLVPYDFSEAERQIVPFIRALVDRFAARITLLSVLPPAFGRVSADISHQLVRMDDHSSEDWRQRLQARLDQALVEELAGVPIERVADNGDPALRIVAFSKKQDVDLIMMPTHSVGTFRSLLVGSVTAKVLHDATCPVWTAAHAETQTACPLPQAILCAVDGSPLSPSIAKWAAEFAHNIGARLHLLHVVGPVSDWPSLESERRLQAQVRDRAQERLATMLTAAGVAEDLRVAVGGIVQIVTEEARQERADLLILGRGAAAEPFGRLRTHAFGIIQRAPCPVLSV